MTTITMPTIAVPAGPPGNRLRWVFADIAHGHLAQPDGLTRIPEALFFSTLQPIMFVLLFRYVFGGAIPIPAASPTSTT